MPKVIGSATPSSTHASPCSKRSMRGARSRYSAGTRLDPEVGRLVDVAVGRDQPVRLTRALGHGVQPTGGAPRPALPAPRRVLAPCAPAATARSSSASRRSPRTARSTRPGCAPTSRASAPSGIGVYLAGSGSGEGYTLTRAERRRVLRARRRGARRARARAGDGGGAAHRAREVVELAEDAVARRARRDAGVLARPRSRVRARRPTSSARTSAPCSTTRPATSSLSTHQSVGYHYEPALLDELLDRVPARRRRERHPPRPRVRGRGRSTRSTGASTCTSAARCTRSAPPRSVRRATSRRRETSRRSCAWR